MEVRFQARDSLRRGPAGLSCLVRFYDPQRVWTSFRVHGPYTVLSGFAARVARCRSGQSCCEWCLALPWCSMAPWALSLRPACRCPITQRQALDRPSRKRPVKRPAIRPPARPTPALPLIRARGLSNIPVRTAASPRPAPAYASRSSRRRLSIRGCRLRIRTMARAFAHCRWATAHRRCRIPPDLPSAEQPWGAAWRLSGCVSGVALRADCLVFTRACG